MIASSDADSVTQEVLSLEKDAIAEAANEIPAVQVRVVSTLHQDVFVRQAREFQPNVVQFTRRGSFEPRIRMLDAAGVLRQITGPTLAKLFALADCHLSFILLMNCSVFRGYKDLFASTNYLVAVKSERQTYELPLVFTQQMHYALTRSRGDADAITQMSSVFARSDLGPGSRLRIYGREPPSGVPASAHQYFEKWPGIEDVGVHAMDAPKQFPMPSAGTSDLLGRSDLAAMEGPRLYRVWFGTNRKQKSDDGRNQFSAERSDRITYGYCDVAIPKYHRIGSLGTPWWSRFPYLWRNNRLTINESKVLDTSDYFRELKRLFEGLPSDERVLLVFLHGYNVTFTNAALRAAQFGFDLGVKGATAFFSWPSKGSIAGYAADVASIEASERYIAEYLERMCESSAASSVHLIAHSMGNRGLLRAFTAMLDRVRATIGKTIHQIFLAAPDVDTDLFCDLAKVYKSVASRATMYVSSKDRALSSSGIVHGHERVGYTPPVTVIEGLDTIQVSNIDLTALGHGYVAQAREVLVDMHALMSADAPPGRRFGLRPAKNAKMQEYWIMQP